MRYLLHIVGRRSSSLSVASRAWRIEYRKQQHFSSPLVHCWALADLHGWAASRQAEEVEEEEIYLNMIIWDNGKGKLTNHKRIFIDQNYRFWLKRDTNSINLHLLLNAFTHSVTIYFRPLVYDPWKIKTIPSSCSSCCLSWAIIPTVKRNHILLSLGSRILSFSLCVDLFIAHKFINNRIPGAFLIFIRPISTHPHRIRTQPLTHE